MKVLVTGNLGYIGTVLTEILVKQNYKVVGLDIGYFKDYFIGEVDSNFFQVFKDIRDIEDKDCMELIPLYIYVDSQMIHWVNLTKI